jgi:hypothetical protein
MQHVAARPVRPVPVWRKSMKRFLFTTAIVVVLALASIADAGPLRHRGGGGCTGESCSAQVVSDSGGCAGPQSRSPRVRLWHARRCR